MYIVDTDHELSNRLNVFHDPSKEPLDARLVTLLMKKLTLYNEYVCTFKTEKEIAPTNQLESYDVCLFNNVPDHRYDPPAPGTLGCIICGDDSITSKYDIIVLSKSGRLQRISKLHPSYMLLQYPLLFPFGEDG